MQMMKKGAISAPIIITQNNLKNHLMLCLNCQKLDIHPSDKKQTLSNSHRSISTTDYWVDERHT